MRRILSLVAALAMVAATFFAVVAYAAPQQSTATKVRVTTKSFKFLLSRRTAPHGKVTFIVTNRDSARHDFKIAGKKTPLLRKGQTRSFTVTLKAGRRYTYICTVPGHAAAGMKGRFRAT
jgi:plastocyanin